MPIIKKSNNRNTIIIDTCHGGKEKERVLLFARERAKGFIQINLIYSSCEL